MIRLKKTVPLILVCGLLLLIPKNLHAWEPNAKDLDAAISVGDFSGYQANISAWLNQKVPADSSGISEAAMKTLLKDPVLANTLDQWQLITKCSAGKIGAFAKADSANRKFLNWLLNGTQSMDLYLEGGVPQDKAYVESLGVLRTIFDADPESHAGMYRRLAIATSLAHATPSTCFGSGEVIDPLKRYQQFKAAHKNNELAAYFGDLTVWEYTKVVDTAASDKDIVWAREMLRTMRPELVREARYVRMVSEVQYTTGDWGPKPHSMATILKGGGKCGPRAWFGRMINAAFGVPVWGVKQPGHAAVGFLGDSGWKVMFGRGWDKSTWGGMNGNKFLEIVRERSYATDFSQAEHLRWIADVLKSTEQASAVKSVAEQIRKNPKGPRTEHKLTCVKYPPPQAEKPWQPVAGVQHIVATEWLKADKASRIPSFDFGKQVYFQKNSDEWVEYKVNVPKAETYGITIGHAVANGDCRVRIYVGDTKIGWMPLNNTKGLWGKTKEVDFALPKTETLRFVFPKQRGVVVKWFELKAKGAAAPSTAEAETKTETKKEAVDPGNPGETE
ncbi:MAG: hypothetical protein WCJ35_08415 [Planctomycetota bacterium]